jgi:hypothetical protein
MNYPDKTPSSISPSDLGAWRRHTPGDKFFAKVWEPLERGAALLFGLAVRWTILGGMILYLTLSTIGVFNTPLEMLTINEIIGGVLRMVLAVGLCFWLFHPGEKHYGFWRWIGTVALLAGLIVWKF